MLCGEPRPPQSRRGSKRERPELQCRSPYRRALFAPPFVFEFPTGESGKRTATVHRSLLRLWSRAARPGRHGSLPGSCCLDGQDPWSRIDGELVSMTRPVPTERRRQSRLNIEIERLRVWRRQGVVSQPKAWPAAWPGLGLGLG